MTCAPGPREAEREGRHVVAQVVDPEDEVLGQGVGVAPDGPADARVHQTVLVPRRVDGLHARQPEVPQEVGVDERRDEGARGAVHVHRHVDAGPLLVGVQRLADLLDRLVGAVEGGAEDGDDADGVLVAALHGLLGRQVQPVAFHRHEAHLHVPVVGELLPAHLDVDAHHEIGLVRGLALGLAPLLPAALEGEAAQHRGLARADRRAARRLVRIRRVPQPAQHVDAAHLQLGRLRVLVLVDHVLVGALAHEELRLRAPSTWSRRWPG